jgi:hypothetical protein
LGSLPPHFAHAKAAANEIDSRPRLANYPGHTPHRIDGQ